MTKEQQHPISAHVDDYIKTLNWSPTATQEVKTCVIGNLRGFAAHLAAIDGNADILDDPRVDKELSRWQEAIRDKLIELGAPDWKIDGAGCDSGDPLDFTLAEVGQGCGWFIDKAEDVATSMRSACIEKVKERLHDPSLRFADDGIKAAVTDWTNMIIKILESVTIQEQEKQR